MGPIGMPPGGMPMGGPGGKPPGRMPGERPMGMPGKRPDEKPHNKPEKDFDLKQMEKESEEMIKMVSLTKENAVFSKTSGGLSLTFNNSTYENVQLIETFPFTDPYVYISVRDISNKNKEIGLIEDLEKDFEAVSIKLIKEQLDLRYHMPVIEKILNVKESGGYSNFTVMTNFGETQFALRSNGTYITALTEKRLIIQDLEGNRFEIPDKNQLSSKALKKLELFM